MGINHSLHDVFTPTRPARLAFVERDDVNEKLVASLETPGKQIVVFGHSGSGKTTLLLNKLHQIYEQHVVSRCMEGTCLEDLVLDAFDQLAPFYESSVADLRSDSRESVLAGEYLGIKASIGSITESGAISESSRLLPPQLTLQRLGKFLGEAGQCWVLEDFHKVVGRDRVRLAQAMKVFMDLADEYPRLKIVALGAVDTARHVVECDHEMRNRVAEVYVPLMHDTELRSIVAKGQKLLRFKMSQQVVDGIVHYSNGLASVCHQLCLNICIAAGITSTCSSIKAIDKNDLDVAVARYIEDASDSLKAAFDRALRRSKVRKYDNGRIILTALARLQQDGASHAEILTEIRKEKASYPSGNLTTYIKQLQQEERGGLIRHDVASGRFSFADPVYRAFAVSQFVASNSGGQTWIRFGKDGIASTSPNEWGVVLKQLHDALMESWK